MKTLSSPKASENQSHTVSGAPSTKSERQQNEAEDCKTSSRVTEAAIWLAENPSQVQGAIIPFVRSRFNLSPVEAIAACKTAHAIRHPKAGGEGAL